MQDFRTPLSTPGNQVALQFKNPVYFVLLYDPANELANLAIQELQGTGKYEISMLPKSYTYYLKAEKDESQFFKKAYSSLFIIFDEKDMQTFKSTYPFFEELQKQVELLTAGPMDLRKKTNSKL